MVFALSFDIELLKTLTPCKFLSVGVIGASFVLMFGFGRIVDVVNKYTVDVLGSVKFPLGSVNVFQPKVK